MLPFSATGQDLGEGSAPRPQRSFVGDAYYPPYLKIVLQSAIFGEEAKRAIWTPDERFVIALFGGQGSAEARSMSLVVWDYRKNHIVNRVMFDAHNESEIYVHDMTVTASGAVTLEASVKPRDGGACEARTLVWEFGKTHPWKRGTARTAQPDCSAVTDDAAAFAASPSGRYRLRYGPVSMVSEALYILDARRGTRLFETAMQEPFAIADAALSPDGQTIAIFTARVRMSEKYASPIILFDLKTSRFREVQLTRGDPCCRVHWLTSDELVALDWDGRGPIVRINARTGQESGPRIEGQCQSGDAAATFTIAGTAIRCRKADRSDPEPALPLSDGSGGEGGGWTVAFDAVAGEIRSHFADQPETTYGLFADVVAAGKMPGSPLFWAVTRNGQLIIGQPEATRDMATVAEIYFFRDGKYFSKTRAEYDTNLPPDTKMFRWINSDNGLDSLGPQSFMRTSFQPRLVRRILDCAPESDCINGPSNFFPRINTILPEVTIKAVKRGTTPHTAKVEIEVREGRGLDTYGKAVMTPAFNLRLFRDGALVAQYPQPMPGRDQTAIEQWRADNLVKPGQGGTSRLSLTVALPSGSEARTVDFTAYAFNEDRVKSETASAEYRQPPITSPRPRRAFVVTFGIDDYDNDQLDLNFAASDARLMGERLSAIPGYDVRQVTIASNRPGERPVKITALTIAHVIAILRGANGDAAKQALRETGFDADRLDRATPDDIVILSFAGHGWADPRGGFFLLPSDARWPRGSDQPDIGSLLSAAQIADRLREVDAGEIALIIDACHSAASVDGGGFKPGPMGDPGLGQLAFDKGIRILAATQSDDVALEDATLRQGLLTYALVGEGLTATGGKADRDGDGRISLDDWFGYAVDRLPELSAEVRRGQAGSDAGVRSWVRTRSAAPPPVQEPALFNFTAKPSIIMLRSGTGQ